MRTVKDELTRIDEGLGKILRDIETETDSNLLLTDIIRTQQENTALGGWKYSQHVDWDNDGDSQAVDISRNSFEGSPEDFARRAYAKGATGVGIYDTHVHIDNNPDRVANPYFKDNRTKFGGYDESKTQIKSFEYFAGSYDRQLAESRKGATFVKALRDEAIANHKLIKIGSLVVAIAVLLGLGDGD